MWEYYSTNYNSSSNGDGDTRLAARMIVDSPLDSQSNDTGAQCVVSLQFVFSVWRSCISQWIDVFNFRATNLDPAIWITTSPQTFPVSQSTSSPCLSELVGVSRSLAGTAWNGGYTTSNATATITGTWEIVGISNNPLP
jgi:hypothetical protein